MTINRRKLLLAAAVSPLAFASRRAPASDLVWSGFALGADAQIRFCETGPQRARVLLDEALSEARRLESVFSVHDPRSEIARLNRDGVLRGPSQDFRLLLSESLRYWRLTEGAFNPAIQPLWSFLAAHFAETPVPPAPQALAQRLTLCDLRGISMKASRVTLAPGMALTFNGIAQGYITERIAQLLAARGMASVLVNLGEQRALAGKLWRIVPEGPEGRGEPIMISNAAVAQSSGAATAFTPDRRWHHLIDPVTGASAGFTSSATVLAATATEADALSTALFVVEPNKRGHILRRFPAVRAWFGGRERLDHSQGM